MNMPIAYTVPNDVPGVQLVVRMDEHPNTSCYLNESYTLKVLLKSGSALHYRGLSHECVGGQVGLLDPGEMLSTSHLSRAKIPDTIHGVLVRPEFVAQMAADINLPSRSLWFRRPVIRHPELFGRISRLLTALQNPASHTVLERQSLLASTLEIAMRNTMEVQRKDPPLRKAHPSTRRARELIHERFATAITVDELVAATGVSRCHLLRTFTHEVGVPPHRYQIHLRIARSRELLAKGFSPAFVAAQMGFYDQGHFTSQFHRIVGVTPGRFGRA
jgi:AraC-like DNA-binding protein